MLEALQQLMAGGGMEPEVVKTAVLPDESILALIHCERDEKRRMAELTPLKDAVWDAVAATEGLHRDKENGDDWDGRIHLATETESGKDEVEITFADGNTKRRELTEDELNAHVVAIAAGNRHHEESQPISQAAWAPIAKLFDFDDIDAVHESGHSIRVDRNLFEAELIRRM